MLVLPRRQTVSSRKRFDFIGSGLFAATLLAILYAMTVWADNPQGTHFFWGLFIFGATVFGIYSALNYSLDPDDPGYGLET